jgi:tripartite-type tricarboxylate transporter receptor subunit TctC
MLRRLSHGLALLASLLVCLTPTGTAWAQAWPSRQPIKLVAVFPPGGSVDQVARLLAPALSAQLGQSVIVENRGGASGSIGAAAVAAAPADGYTFAVVFDTHGVNPSLIPNLPFDSRKDLSPVVLVGTAPMVLGTPAGSDFKSFGDVVAAAKTGQGASYGSIGSGSLGHLAMALLGKSAGLNFQHIPYKGGGQSLPAFLAGEHDIWTGSLQSIWPHVRAGNATLLAVSAGTRLPVIADVPSLSEVVPGFAMESHTGLLGPANLPPAIVAKLSAALKTVLADPAIRTKLSAEGSRTVRWTTSQEYQDMIRANLKKYDKATKQANIKAE